MFRDVRARWALTLLLTTLPLAALPACGGSGAYPEDPAFEPEREDPSALEAEQIEQETALSELLQSPEPDCGRACELGASMCDLRERICGIADRHPSDEQTRGRCTDATARCDRARERVAERCACETQ